MSRRWLIVTSFLLLSGLAIAQNHPQSSGTSDLEPVAPPVDLAKIKTGLSGSYYHPLDLAGMDCDAVIGWADLMKQLKRPTSADGLKLLEAMTVSIKARRGRTAEVTFAWPAGEPANKQAIEDGDRMMLNGFYQMYWSGLASALGPQGEEWNNVRAEPRHDGGYVLHYVSQGSPVTEELDAEFLPVKVSVNTATGLVEMSVHYAPSPQPQPGDSRRVTSMETSQHTGNSVANVQFQITYQQIGGYWIPAHLAVGMVGAYSVPIDLIGCSVSKEVKVAPPLEPEPVQ